jgi:formate-nitrite transporter family protein
LVTASGSSSFPIFIFPVGFIPVMVGRAQLFTENTLYPVILVLDERRHFTQIFRLWGIVLTSNVVGAFLFALLAIKSAALRPEIAAQLVKLGLDSMHGSGAYFFWSGVIGGWLIAWVAWVVSRSHWTIGQVVMVCLLAFVVGVGRYAHCIATSGEILSAVLAGRLGAGVYLHWLLLATLAISLAAFVMVSLLNYGQVREA